VRNPVSVWQLGEATSALLAPPMDETESQYRLLGGHREIGLQSSGGPPEMQLVGVFDPARVRAFDPLSRVPLGPFQPTTAAPANAATRNTLGGDLLPNLNLGGYVSQPAQLITTLNALPVLEASGAFSGNTHASDPISVIRVRVAGVSGPNPVSPGRTLIGVVSLAVGVAALTLLTAVTVAYRGSWWVRCWATRWPCRSGAWTTWRSRRRSRWGCWPSPMWCS
jgi:hypothetical protein